MSIEAMAIALHHAKAKGTALNVLLGIANHEGDGGAWPSVETLAKYGRCGERRVQQIIRELEEAGEIAVEMQAGGLPSRMSPRHRPNRYHILVRCPADCDGTAQHRRKRPVPPGQRRGAGDFTPGGVKSGAGWGETSDARGVKSPAPEPSYEPSSNNRPNGTEQNWRSDLRFAPVGAHATEDPDFDEDEEFDDWRPEDRELFQVYAGERITSDGSRWTAGTFPDTPVYNAIWKLYRTRDGKRIKWPGRYLQTLDERGQVEEWLATQGLETAE